MKRRRTALLVLAEESDRIAYMRWLRAQGIIYRSMDGPVMVNAMRRVVRGELFVQNRSSELKKNQAEHGMTAIEVSANDYRKARLHKG